MSASFSTPATPSSSKIPDLTATKLLVNYNHDDCLSLLRKEGLQHLEHNFIRAEVDGSLLVCLKNPHIRESILDGLGIHDLSDKEAVVNAVNTL